MPANFRSGLAVYAMLRRLPKVALGFAVPVDAHLPVGAALLALSLVPAGLKILPSIGARTAVQEQQTAAIIAAKDATTIGLIRAKTCLIVAKDDRIEEGAKVEYPGGVTVANGVALCDPYAGLTAEVKGGLIVGVQPIENNQLQAAIAARSTQVKSK
jgi:hypothetical protein